MKALPKKSAEDLAERLRLKSCRSRSSSDCCRPPGPPLGAMAGTRALPPSALPRLLPGHAASGAGGGGLFPQYFRVAAGRRRSSEERPLPTVADRYRPVPRVPVAEASEYWWGTPEDGLPVAAAVRVWLGEGAKHGGEPARSPACFCHPAKPPTSSSRSRGAVACVLGVFFLFVWVFLCVLFFLKRVQV